MSNLPIPDVFGGWLRSSWKRLAIPPITIGLPALLTAAAHLRTIESWRWLKPTLISLQLFTIVALLLVLPHPLIDRNRSRRATLAAEQFSHWWRLLWLFWLAEYAILLCNEIVSTLNPIFEPWASVLGATLLNVGNNLPTIGLIICYHITAARTVSEVDGTVEPRRLPWEKPIVIVIFLMITEFIVRANEAISPHPISGIPQNAIQIFAWISGIAAGLATALLVGRLDSRFIGLSPYIITLLYVYAVIQAAWPTFGDNPMTRIVIVNIALALKILLFAVMYWLFRSGVLLYYLEQIAGVYEHGRVQRQDFLVRVQRNLTPVRKAV